ncbi:response regulator transcription factor [Acinetobacter rudis]|uniref:Response regulator transcription factor n=1 Tax=Acinetobacter rudis TaxID=632955 RepID=A0AAW8J9F4_9GAMM|nr:response regulator transcription factor [Acinetobacter rudis]MDQ8936395.1 response regulator transcription factor [Acinetobacter rudis]MDQ9018654.1 response regulator transcription factor [Acinetobacter rudis]
MQQSESIFPVPVLVVEDEPLMQARLKEILEFIGYQANDIIFAQTLKQAEELYKLHSVSLALIDLGLPDGSGNEFIRYLRKHDASIGILVISAWSTEDAIFEALKSGATGYVLKERDDIEVAMAIRSVLRGGAPIDPFMAQKILKQLDLEEKKACEESPQQAITKILTNREQQILELVATGLSNKEIADQINLSRYTVESHIKHIYRKLAVCTRTKAVDTARNLGLLD